jgi:two-component system chemotaxis response regulator CheB
MGKIRVLVVDDSLTVRKRLVEVLNADPELEVIAEAEDGKTAIELCQRLRPDVITLDMMLPVMTGLAATEYIMAYFPTPILIVSASTNRGELFRTYEALAAGALDVLEKPTGDELDGNWERKLVSAVKLASRIKVITHPRARLGLSRHSAELVAGKPAVPAPFVERRLVAIGASTGGPNAVVKILRALPKTFPLPILLVIHIGKPFAAGLAEWLGGESNLSVGYANDGDDLPQVGTSRVIMAPPDLHMIVSQGKLRLTNDAARHSCKPSVDVLFESVAREYGNRSVACLLTGMGRDGASGMLAIRQSGGLTMAQDEATSVVYGMPREAVLLGGADSVLPLDQFANSLIAAAGNDRRLR